MLNEQKSTKAQVFGLPAPTRESALKNMSRVVGVEEANKLWDRICLINRVNPTTNNLNELEIVFKELSLIDGAIGVCGKSLMVITMTHRNLNRV